MRKYKKRICGSCHRKVVKEFHKCSGKTKVQKRKEKDKKWDQLNGQ